MTKYETKLLKRLEFGEVRCDVIRHNTGRVGAHIYPLYPSTFWRVHTDVALTEKELREILGAVEEGKK